MGTSIMAKIREGDNPINRYNLLLANTICSSRIFKNMVMGIIPLLDWGKANAPFLWE